MKIQNKKFNVFAVLKKFNLICWVFPANLHILIYQKKIKQPKTLTHTQFVFNFSAHINKSFEIFVLLLELFWMRSNYNSAENVKLLMFILFLSPLNFQS